MTKSKYWALLVVSGCLPLFLFFNQFLGWFLMGVVLSEMTRPLYQRMREWVSDSISAAASVSMVFILVVSIFAIIGGFVSNDASDLVSQAKSIDSDFLDNISNEAENLTGFNIDAEQKLRDLVAAAAGRIATGFSSVMSFATNTLIGASVMVFTQFYILRDGAKLVSWFRDLRVFEQENFEEFLDRNREAAWAVFEGHVLMAFAMAILVGAGLLLTGVPNPFFWTFVMMILGLIPMVGTLMVWAPSAAYLFLEGSILPAAALVIYSGLITTLGDNFLRPYLVGESDEMHPYYVLIGVIGGASIFGPVGLFVGPIIFSFVKTSVENYSELVNQHN